MKLYKKLFPMLIAALAFTACGEQDAEGYQKGSADALGTYGNFYFPTTSYSIELEPTEPTTYEVAVSRADSSAAVTVPIEIVGSDVITASDAVFAAGQASTTITLSFPNAEVGTTYSANISAKDVSYLKPCTFSVTRVKWNDVGFYYDANGNKVEGYCNYTDDFIASLYGASCTTHPVKVQERDDKKGYFRILNAYENFYYCQTGAFVYDNSSDHHIYIDATDPEKVYMPTSYDTGAYYYTGSDGNVIVYCLAGYNLDNGKDPSSYYGKYANGKITFPTQSLLVTVTSESGWYYGNNNGKFSLVINPDLDPYQADIEEDFDWEDVFTGELKSAMLNNVSQVTLCKGTCTNTKDDCDSTFAATYGTAYAIGDMYAVNYPIYFAVNKDGEITLPITDPQPTGIKALNEDVYATINASASSFTDRVITLNMTFTNKDGSITYGTFDEVLSNITWSQVGTGTYTYLSTMWGEGAADSGLALYQRDDEPSTYKITNWLMGVDFMFTWDSETNKCVVAEQETGYTHSSYGMVYVMETNKYSSKLAEEASSYYDPATNTFNFNVIYFVSAGSFGHGMETFALDAAVSTAKATSSKAYKAKAAKASKKHLKKVSLKKNLKRTYNLKGTRVNFKNNIKKVGVAF